MRPPRRNGDRHLARMNRRPPDPALPVGEEKSRAVRTMFDTIAPRYDTVNKLISLGLDRGWRRKAVRSLALPKGSRILDVACGTGDLCRETAAAGHRPIGLDYAGEMLAHARTDAPLVQADALRLPARDGSIDGITCGFALRNVTDLGQLFDGFARVLRPGGRIALLDVHEPTNPIVRAGHHVWFHRVVPLIGGALSDRAAYHYLPRSTAYLPPSDEMVAMLKARGFARVRCTKLSGGLVQLLTGTRE